MYEELQFLIRFICEFNNKRVTIEFVKLRRFQVSVDEKALTVDLSDAIESIIESTKPVQQDADEPTE